TQLTQIHVVVDLSVVVGVARQVDSGVVNESNLIRIIVGGSNLQASLKVADTLEQIVAGALARAVQSSNLGEIVDVDSVAGGAENALLVSNVPDADAVVEHIGIEVGVDRSAQAAIVVLRDLGGAFA